VLIAAIALLPGCKTKNLTPDVPAVPSGPAAGWRDSVLTYQSSAADPDGDSVAIRFDWGDGDTSEWSAWVANGAAVADSHAWSAVDGYAVRAQAKDKAGLESEWSGPTAFAVVRWAVTFGGTNIEYGNAVCLSPDGGYVITGVTESYGAGSWDAYLIKTDSSGDTLWARTFGGIHTDQGCSVQPTADGGYVITGIADSSVSQDIWLIKTDAEGNQVWARTFGGPDADHGYSVQPTSDGGYIIVGETWSFANKYDACLIKTDASGTEEWTETFGGAGFDEFYSVRQTADGGYVVAGGTEPESAGLSDVWLIKVDESGDEEWTKTFGGSGNDYANSVEQTSDGGFIVVGSTNSYGAGYFDAYLTKTDADGNQVWAKTFGGTGGEGGASVRQTSDGGYVIAGSTESFGNGQGDAWLVRTDASGNELWSTALGGPDWDCGSSVVVAPNGGYVMCGTTESYDVGGKDVWLVWIDANGSAVTSGSAGYQGLSEDR